MSVPVSKGTWTKHTRAARGLLSGSSLSTAVKLFHANVSYTQLTIELLSYSSDRGLRRLTSDKPHSWRMFHIVTEAKARRVLRDTASSCSFIYRLRFSQEPHALSYSGRSERPGFAFTCTLTLDDEVWADVGVAGVGGHQAKERARGSVEQQPGVKHVKACIQASSKAFRFVSHRLNPDALSPLRTCYRTVRARVGRREARE